MPSLQFVVPIRILLTISSYCSPSIVIIIFMILMLTSPYFMSLAFLYYSPEILYVALKIALSVAFWWRMSKEAIIDYIGLIQYIAL